MSSPYYQVYISGDIASQVDFLKSELQRLRFEEETQSKTYLIVRSDLQDVWQKLVSLRAHIKRYQNEIDDVRIELAALEVEKSYWRGDLDQVTDSLHNMTLASADRAAAAQLLRDNLFLKDTLQSNLAAVEEKVAESRKNQLLLSQCLRDLATKAGHMVSNSIEGLSVINESMDVRSKLLNVSKQLEELESKKQQIERQLKLVQRELNNTLNIPASPQHKELRSSLGSSNRDVHNSTLSSSQRGLGVDDEIWGVVAHGPPLTQDLSHTLLSSTPILPLAQPNGINILHEDGVYMYTLEEVLKGEGEVIRMNGEGGKGYMTRLERRLGCLGALERGVIDEFNEKLLVVKKHKHILRDIELKKVKVEMQILQLEKNVLETSQKKAETQQTATNEKQQGTTKKRETVSSLFSPTHPPETPEEIIDTPFFSSNGSKLTPSALFSSPGRESHIPRYSGRKNSSPTKTANLASSGSNSKQASKNVAGGTPVSNNTTSPGNMANKPASSSSNSASRDNNAKLGMSINTSDDHMDKGKNNSVNNGKDMGLPGNGRGLLASLHNLTQSLPPSPRTHENILALIAKYLEERGEGWGWMRQEDKGGLVADRDIGVKEEKEGAGEKGQITPPSKQNNQYETFLQQVTYLVHMLEQDENQRPTPGNHGNDAKGAHLMCSPLPPTPASTTSSAQGSPSKRIRKVLSNSKDNSTREERGISPLGRNKRKIKGENSHIYSNHTTVTTTETDIATEPTTPIPNHPTHINNNTMESHHSDHVNQSSRGNHGETSLVCADTSSGPTILKLSSPLPPILLSPDMITRTDPVSQSAVKRREENRQTLYQLIGRLVEGSMATTELENSDNVDVDVEEEVEEDAQAPDVKGLWNSLWGALEQQKQELEALLSLRKHIEASSTPASALHSFSQDNPTQNNADAHVEVEDESAPSPPPPPPETYDTSFAYNNTTHENNHDHGHADDFTASVLVDIQDKLEMLERAMEKAKQSSKASKSAEIQIEVVSAAHLPALSSLTRSCSTYVEVALLGVREGLSVCDGLDEFVSQIVDLVPHAAHGHAVKLKLDEEERSTTSTLTSTSTPAFPMEVLGYKRTSIQHNTCYPEWREVLAMPVNLPTLNTHTPPVHRMAVYVMVREGTRDEVVGVAWKELLQGVGVEGSWRTWSLDLAPPHPSLRRRGRPSASNQPTPQLKLSCRHSLPLTHTLNTLRTQGRELVQLLSNPQTDTLPEDDTPSTSVWRKKYKAWEKLVLRVLGIKEQGTSASKRGTNPTPNTSFISVNSGGASSRPAHNTHIRVAPLLGLREREKKREREATMLRQQTHLNKRSSSSRRTRDTSVDRSFSSVFNASMMGEGDVSFSSTTSTQRIQKKGRFLSPQKKSDPPQANTLFRPLPFPPPAAHTRQSLDIHTEDNASGMVSEDDGNVPKAVRGRSGSPSPTRRTQSSKLNVPSLNIFKGSAYASKS